MARRRRPVVDDRPAGLALYDDEPIRARDRVDARVWLAAPDDVAAHPERLLAWAQLHAPAYVLPEAGAALARDRRVRRERLHQARADARRRGLPEPSLDDFPMPERGTRPA